MALFQPDLPNHINPWTVRRLRHYNAAIRSSEDNQTKHIESLCDAPLLAPVFEHHTETCAIYLVWVDAPTCAIVCPDASHRRALEVATMEVICRQMMANHNMGIEWNVPAIMQGVRALIVCKQPTSQEDIIEAVTTHLPGYMNTSKALASALMSRVTIL